MAHEFFHVSEKDKDIETRTKRARQNIQEYLDGVEIESPRFQAFADYTDLINTEQNVSEDHPHALARTEYCLVKETIRQRTNGITGYKYEFDRMVEMTRRLSHAIVLDKESGINESDDYVVLYTLKNHLIDKKALR